MRKGTLLDQSFFVVVNVSFEKNKLFSLLLLTPKIKIFVMGHETYTFVTDHVSVFE